jgi:hypothetical protein
MWDLPTAKTPANRATITMAAAEHEGVVCFSVKARVQPFGAYIFNTVQYKDYAHRPIQSACGDIGRG